MDLQPNEFVYDDVIKSVMENLEDVFLENGISADVRRQLETTWRNKLIENNCLLKPPENHVNEPSSDKLSPNKLVKSKCNQNSAKSLAAGKQEKKRKTNINQLDGSPETSSGEEADSSSEIENEKEVGNSTGSNSEDDPLNSDDDITDDEEPFVTDNIIVCQYEKINKRLGKWKMHLKNGIMNIDGKDYVFHTLTGDTSF